MKVKLTNNKKLNNITLIAAEVLAVLIIVYLATFPFYPRLKYEIGKSDNENPIDYKNAGEVVNEAFTAIGSLPKNEYTENRLYVAKIGVNAPIIESRSEFYGLDKGSWRVPNSSTPDKGGNTVITGHRFKYLPPNNVTFYLLDKLEAGDIIVVVWDKSLYYYKVKETKIVPAEDLSVLNQTESPTLTLFTCHPLFSTAKRFVVISELFGKNPYIEL